MKNLLLLFLFCVGIFAGDTRHFELRIYENNRGKLEGTLERFRNDVSQLFQKHGLDPIGFWTGKNEKGADVFVYLLAAPSKEAFDKRTKEFGDDPEFKAAYAASTQKLGNTVRKIESYPLTATDWSPKIEPSKNEEPRTFELRIYNVRPGKMEPYLESYRDHRLAIFEKHGFENIGFWTVNGDNKFVLLLANKNAEAIAKGKDAYHSDPDWKAMQRSLQDQGSMTGDVSSLVLTPTDFSKTR